jgi:hypothetical protein
MMCKILAECGVPPCSNLIPLAFVCCGSAAVTAAVLHGVVVASTVQRLPQTDLPGMLHPAAATSLLVYYCVLRSVLLDLLMYPNTGQ